MNHFSNSQLQAFLEGKLPSPQLLDFDDHLAVCEQCRVCLEQEARAGAAVSLLQTDFAADEPHLEYEQLHKLAHGEPVAPEVENHRATCAICAAEVDALQQFAAEVTSTPRASIRLLAFTPPRPRKRRVNPAWIGLAAAVVLAVTAGLYWRSSIRSGARESIVASLRDGNAQLSLDTTGQLHGAEALSQSDRDALKSAMTTGRLESSQGSTAGQKQETMLGAPAVTAPFKVLSPVNRATVDDRPTFSWEPMAGSRGYRVTVYAAGYRRLAESPVVRETSWRSTVELSRGESYTWTVTASGPKGTVREPAPPEPEARFKVMPADTASQLESAGRNHGTDHLLLAVLFARAGAIDEARGQLDMLAGQNPNSALVAQLKASLDQVAPSPIKTNAAQ